MSLRNTGKLSGNATDQPTQQRQLKIYMEEAKARQTTHWDLDYMTTAELDALLMPTQRRQSQVKSISALKCNGLRPSFDLALLAVALGSGLWLGFWLH